MGRGNVQLLEFDGSNAETFYISYFDDIQGEVWDSWNMLLEQLQECLKEAGLRCTEDKHYSELKRTYNGHVLQIAEGDYCIVVVEDNESSIAIGVIRKCDVFDGEEIEPHGTELQYKTERNNIISHLNNSFELYVRTSAWTSGKYKQ